ncbi:Methyltransferase type 11 [Kribbella flavida DSM 17836]|uniref:Methyltransferase type 11 n=1 Tax=Kribbella flavida (strain DSM 17836 / JCM 10339 / NBRC 14399) TaxID=479435 RepID=D2PSJ1_KRIFD|nr:class I SAM-dependent methyltransferase [Kribbella flavida]ADB33129.1 Methyltransferase type 11 [Kribbella flavida DSM 17836]
MTGRTSWQEWQRRWDLQQGNYLPERERTLSLMLDIIRRTTGPNPRLLDLGCGPGSLLTRAFQHLPGGDLVGVDLDPLLLEIARNVAGDRGMFLQADFCQEGWDLPLDDRHFDAVCSASVIHYLHPSQLDPLLTTLANRLRPGGILLIADTFRLGRQHRPRLDQLAVDLRQHHWDGEGTAGAETWTQWWQAARAEPAFEQLFRQRDKALAGVVDHQAELTVSMVTIALEHAGFSEIATLDQTADHHLIAAVR